MRASVRSMPRDLDSRDLVANDVEVMRLVAAAHASAATGPGEARLGSPLPYAPLSAPLVRPATTYRCSTM